MANNQDRSNYNVDIQPIDPIMVPRNADELNAFKEDNHMKFLEKKAFLLAKEKANLIDKNKRLCCPTCKYAVHVKYNFSELGWRCYSCGAKDFEPKPRDYGYFDEIVSEKVVEKMKFIAVNGVVERAPIKVTQVKKRNTRRGFRDTDLMTRDQILNILSSKYENAYQMTKKDIRNSALMATLFLTGARIQELCGIPAREQVTLPNGEKRGGNKIKGVYEIEPLRRKQVTVEKMMVDDKEIDVICFKNLPVLKRRISETIDKDTYQSVRGVVHRNISIPYEVEQKFWFFIERYIRNIKDPEAILFSMVKNNAFKIIWRYFNKKYNHWFRHQRASDLSVTYNLNNIQMQHFFGWSSSKMADRYTHLSDTDLLKSMVRKNS